MGHLLLLALLAAPGIEVKARPLAGPEVAGTLVQLSPEALVLKTASGEKSLNVKQLAAVTRTGDSTESTEKTKVWVDLVDGSELLAAKFVCAQNKATLTLVGGVVVEIPTRSIRSVRLNSPDPALAKQWTEILESKASGDTLVIRKVSTVKVEGDDKVGEKTQVALDSLEGLLKDVTPDVVQFVFDGDTLDVRREKIEGFVYYHAVERDLPEAVCRVSDSAGSRWQVRSVTLAGEQLEITSVAGVKVNLPLARFGQLDYSAGNTVFLADLKPDAAEVQPRLDNRFTAKYAKFFGPRSPETETDSPAAREGAPGKGMILSSRTLLAYRLPEKTHWFEAAIKLDDSLSEELQLRFVVLGDNKPLFDEPISGGKQRREIKLDVSGVRRLSILVDHGNEPDSLQLQLIDARITK